MTTLNGVAANPADPLWKNAPERVEHLTKLFAEAAHLFSTEDVINAGASVMITAMRQAYVTRNEAEARFNEVMGQTKTHFLKHYDSITGRKHGLFPFDQTISAELVRVTPSFSPKE